MRVVIIGGSGFIGSHVTRQLVHLGHQVTNFHRGQTACDLQVDTILGSREKLESFRRRFEQLKPEVVVDMIAMSENDTRQLINTFDGIARRTVVISSADVYRSYELVRGTEKGPADPLPISETAPLRKKLFPYRTEQMDATNPAYNYEKILVERVARGSQSLPATILRLPCVYGPGDKQHRLHHYLKRMGKGRTGILLERDQVNWRWTRGYVENIAAAICSAVGDETPIGRIYNLGEVRGLSEKDWVRSIGDQAGWTGRIVGADPVGLPKNLRSGLVWQHHLETDTSLIRRELGFSEPVSFELGLQKTIVWERANPPNTTESEDLSYEAEGRILSLLIGESI